VINIYVELIFILNVWIDFLLLLSVSIVLKKKTSFFKICLGSMIGGMSTFFLFFDISDFSFNVLKFFVCCLMIFISFRFNSLVSFFEEVFYFYLISIVLAGVFILVNQNCVINDFLVNFLVLFFITPFILYVFCRKSRKLGFYYNKIYNVKLFYDDVCYNFLGFLDTGNKLYDQYKRRPIILVYTKDIVFDYEKGILVPYETASGKNVLKCLKASKIIIDDKIVKYNVIFGLVDKKFQMEEVDMILHFDLMEEL